VINYKEKLLNLPNRLNVNSPIGYLQNLHLTVNLFDNSKPEDFICLKSLYLNYDSLKTRAKRR
jgi:hypothetical protein